MSGSLTGHFLRWSVVEKEAFAVIESITKLDYQTAMSEVHIFTDKSNLTYIFDPYRCNPGISKRVSSKLMRWALKLCSYRYLIEFLPGSKNVWADMLSTWAVRSIMRSSTEKFAAVMYAPIDSSEKDSIQ